MSKRDTTKLELNRRNRPALSAGQRKRLKALAAMPDSDIDYSDIPRSVGRMKWTRPGALVAAESKQQITLRIDADVLRFFKKTGERYQSRINAVLREYVNAHSREAP
jgi:uncharacterized protein (DUF4415 family)